MTTTRSELCDQLLDQLFVKRVEVQAEKLFCILLLVVLYTGQHISVTIGRYVVRERTSKPLSFLFSFIAS